MKKEILEILKSKDEYFSGEQISEMLGCSRNAVWKLINKLKEEGYEFHSVTNKGYKLLHEPDLVTQEQVMDGLKTTTLGKRIVFEKEVDSTNECAKRGGAKGDQEGCVYLCEMQSLGKGRRGSSWTSEAGAGIYMSILLRPGLMPADVTRITLIAGLAVCYAINEITPLRTKIKWPNDVVANGKKLCGILTEMVAEIDAVDYVVVGIGINVNNERLDEKIQDSATSIFLQTGTQFRRKTLIQAVLYHFERLYERLLSTNDLTSMMDDYKKMCITYKAQVQAQYNNKQIIGCCDDILPNGELVVISDEGIRYILNAGEVSVRGLYGYT